MDDKIVGVCTSSVYNATEKVIRFFLQFPNGKEQGFEWPISLFSFSPGQDKDEEMRKLSNMMIKKKIGVKSNTNVR